MKPNAVKNRSHIHRHRDLYMAVNGELYFIERHFEENTASENDHGGKKNRSLITQSNTNRKYCIFHRKKKQLMRVPKMSTLKM